MCAYEDQRLERAERRKEFQWAVSGDPGSTLLKADDFTAAATMSGADSSVADFLNATMRGVWTRWLPIFDPSHESDTMACAGAGEPRV